MTIIHKPEEPIFRRKKNEIFSSSAYIRKSDWQKNIRSFQPSWKSKDIENDYSTFTLTNAAFFPV